MVGMSRPTLYHVLHDENQFSSDQIQLLCYQLAFLSQRATRSIGIVSPSYRAHIAAFYARMFLEGDEFSETASIVSGGTGGGSAGVANITLKKLASGMERTMYYM